MEPSEVRYARVNFVVSFGPERRRRAYFALLMMVQSQKSRPTSHWMPLMLFGRSGAPRVHCRCRNEQSIILRPHRNVSTHALCILLNDRSPTPYALRCSPNTLAKWFCAAGDGVDPTPSFSSFVLPLFPSQVHIRKHSIPLSTKFDERVFVYSLSIVKSTDTWGYGFSVGNTFLSSSFDY